MIFTSLEYLLFFVLIIATRAPVKNLSAEKWVLLIVSYIFYMSWSVPCVLLIITTSLIDYFVGLQLNKEELVQKRKRWVAISIAANLSILGFFKYYHFFIASAGWGLKAIGVNTENLRFDVILPVGISFFTFQSMSHTIDVYRRKIAPCRNARDYLLFVSFFPQLVAGPIVRAVDFMPQLAKRVRARAVDFESGLSQFGLGAVKKLVISDQVAPGVELIFSNPENFDGPTLVLGVLGYAIQIYCDFSGYSDMAIGSARMMGFRFMENFQMPYSAASITEFWHRWHISLSSWFRDYLYIPLGGNRKGVNRMYANLLVTMLLCGLWHGASWNFVFWGGLHGAALALHKAWNAWNPLSSLLSKPIISFAWNVASRFVTLLIVMIGWIFFRAQSWTTANDYLWRMISMTENGTRLLDPQILVALLGVGVVHLCFNKDLNWAKDLPERTVSYRIAAYTSMLTLIVCLGATDSAPFIYFQF